METDNSLLQCKKIISPLYVFVLQMTLPFTVSVSMLCFISIEIMAHSAFGSLAVALVPELLSHWLLSCKLHHATTLVVHFRHLVFEVNARFTANLQFAYLLPVANFSSLFSTICVSWVQSI